MTLDFFRFELRFWLRGSMVYIFLVILGLMVFGATSSDSVQIAGALSNSHRNAPHVIQNFYALMSLLSCLMVTAFVAGASTRDFAYNTHQVIFTKPLSKLAYLMGRFWGSVLVAMVPLLGVSLGVIFAGFMPWIDEVRLGPIHWQAHFWGFVNFAIPNVILISAIVFAIGAWTRSTIASFIGVIVVLVGYGVTAAMLGNLENESLAALLDPMGIRAFGLQTKFWTVAERNSMALPLTGMLLWNRLLWLGASGVVLLVACWRFQFAERRRAGKVKAIVESVAESRTLPSVNFHHGLATQLAQLSSQIKMDFWGIVKSNVFIVIMLAAIANMLPSLFLSAQEGFGVSSLPVTYHMVDIIRGSMYLFLIAVITFYTGVLVWRERDAKIDEVLDAAPQPTWVAYVGKLISMMLVIFVIQLLAISAGVMAQAWHGYDRYQLGLYAKELLVLDYMAFFFLVVLSLIAHVVSPNKYIGYFVFISTIIANSFGWQLLEVETRMVRFGDIPGYTYSDLFEFAPFVPGILGFSVYWLLFALLVSALTIVLWQRGKDLRYRERLRAMLTRTRGTVALFGGLVLLAWSASAGWVYYNTNVLNERQTSEQRQQLQADYEKQFKKKHEKVLQPRITGLVRYDIDIYPEKRGLVMRGQQTLENTEDAPIDQLFVAYDGNYDVEIEIQQTELEQDYEDMNYRVYRFEPPLQPGDKVEMRFTVQYEAKGFEESVSNSSVVQNGTFFNNAIAPQIGYQAGRELSGKNDRRDFGLGERDRMPSLEPNNIEARRNTYISNSSDWVEVETYITTSSDQRAIAPGSLINSWQKDGRNCFHYRVDHPSLNFYSFISARYEVAVQHWKGVDIEVYYHKDHEWNVGNMLRSIRKSLEYYTDNFGPYKHKQARIIEFPRVASFAQAFPGTMPYSEGIGFIADITKADDIDMVYYVVAHEMAHQWWAHQVIGANMQGATVLSETLAQYSALMVMEKEFGRDMMRKFLKYEMDSYLRSRGRESLKERPLAEVESAQGYIHYRKGSVVMYYLKELIGEEKINAALRSLINKYAYKGPPYPTSEDLIIALREQTPEDYHYLYEDLFYNITLFANRTLSASYSKRTDGKFDVTIEIECRKFYADDQGNESESELADWIEIGAFAKPEGDRQYGKTLHRERVRVTETENKFTFMVDEVPQVAGVDPFALLIDRMPKDNMKKVRLAD